MAQVPYEEDLSVIVICQDCRENPPNLSEDHSSGDLICASCGLVLQERSIDTSSEWRTFANDDQGSDDPSRVGDGPNALLNGSQLNTGIAFGEGGLRNKELQRAQNKNSLDKGNKNLLQAYKQIGAFCDGWQLPSSITDAAKHLFKSAIENKAFKGKSQDSIIAGCVFLSCRRANVARSFREVMELTGIGKKEIGRIFKMLEALMYEQQQKDGSKTSTVGSQLVQNEEYKGSNTAPPSELCDRYCDMLNMSHQTTQVARTLAENMTKTGALAGRSPLSAAAACIFMAGHLMGETKSAKDIQGVVHVSDSTIRHSYKLLYQDRDKLITEEITGRGADPEKLPKPA